MMNEYMKVENLGKWTKPDPMGPEPGKIIAAAIRQDDEIWIGRRHHEIIHEIAEVTGVKPVTGEQGFWTEDGWWLRRPAAMSVALMNGQVEQGKTTHPHDLFSEDLW